ncbi:unnamed protein product [Cyclocybe aegerita]|uniref:Uncharacterized protein n=1 Tax=Cyclocybe aegerita TaxID=1973307 RepID=A0A8S0VYL1_CYCAE|nr:unnamed protein product [Cyclocybe aegerita]
MKVPYRIGVNSVPPSTSSLGPFVNTVMPMLFLLCLYVQPSKQSASAPEADIGHHVFGFIPFFWELEVVIVEYERGGRLRIRRQHLQSAMLDILSTSNIFSF